MAASPHILLVDDYGFANIGGGEQHLMHVARGCREWGYRVGIVCIPRSGLERVALAEGFEAWPVPFGRKHPMAARALKDLFARLQPDIVHSHSLYSALQAASSAREARVPVIVSTVHTMPSACLELRPGLPGRAEYALRAHLYRRVSSSVDRFVCVVHAVQEELASLGVDRSRLTVIPNGIPDPLSSHPSTTPSTADEVIVGSVGRLELPKGYEYFVAAAALVAKSNPAVRFRLVGDGSLKLRLEAQRDALKLEASFEMTGWSSDALAQIASMDIYVAPSLTDTTNLTVLEAMGLGRAVVATNVGGLPDAVTEGVNGYLVPPRRPDLLAEKILALAADNQVRDAMGARSRERFETDFTVGHMLARYRALYEEMLGAARVRA